MLVYPRADVSAFEQAVQILGCPMCPVPGSSAATCVLDESETTMESTVKVFWPAHTCLLATECIQSVVGGIDAAALARSPLDPVRGCAERNRCSEPALVDTLPT